MGTPGVNDAATRVNGANSEEHRCALEDVLHSNTFASRPRLREFLRYVGEAAITGQGEAIKEHSIGVAVFGRHEDYSSNEDTIVRVTARQLRQKLDEYYRDEGRQAEWRIEIPRGTYVPAFVHQSQVIPDAAAGSVRQPLVVGKVWSPWVAALLLAVVAVMVAIGAWWWAAEDETTLLGLVQPPEGHRVNVVCGDAIVQIYKEITGFAPTVADYESGGYLRAPEFLAAIGDNNQTWQVMGNRKLLATGNLQVLTRLMEAAPASKLTVRHPRDVTLRDFVEDNAILLSGPFANPWVQLFEERLNFQIVQDDVNTAQVRNLAPRAGEESVYRQVKANGQRIAYARLAYLPNLSGQGRVLLIGGPSSALMEVMAAAVTEPAFLRDLASKLGVEDPRELPFCEMLMEVTEVGDAPLQTRVIALRAVK